MVQIATVIAHHAHVVASQFGRTVGWIRATKKRHPRFAVLTRRAENAGRQQKSEARESSEGLIQHLNSGQREKFLPYCMERVRGVLRGLPLMSTPLGAACICPIIEPPSRPPRSDRSALKTLRAAEVAVGVREAFRRFSNETAQRPATEPMASGVQAAVNQTTMISSCRASE